MRRVPLAGTVWLETAKTQRGEAVVSVDLEFFHAETQRRGGRRGAMGKRSLNFHNEQLSDDEGVMYRAPKNPRRHALFFQIGVQRKLSG
jgi:hypothetical protein